MTWATIGNIFGLNGGIIFRPVPENRWTYQTVRRLPSLLADEIIALRSFLMDRYQQKKPVSAADIDYFILIETESSFPLTRSPYDHPPPWI
jgi:hypothetical protein